MAAPAVLTSWIDVLTHSLVGRNTASRAPMFDRIHILREDFYDTLRNEWLYAQVRPTRRQVEYMASKIYSARNLAIATSRRMLDDLVVYWQSTDATKVHLFFQVPWELGGPLDLKVVLEAILQDNLSDLPDRVRQGAVNLLVAECALILLRTPVAILDGEGLEIKVLRGQLSSGDSVDLLPGLKIPGEHGPMKSIRPVRILLRDFT